MLRLAAELADEWNAGIRPPEDLAPMLEAVNAACMAAGRDPRSRVRPAEALVEAGPGFEPAEILERFARYGALGIGHVQIQRRPNTIAGSARSRKSWQRSGTARS